MSIVFEAYTGPSSAGSTGNSALPKFLAFAAADDPGVYARGGLTFFGAATATNSGAASGRIKFGSLSGLLGTRVGRAALPAFGSFGTEDALSVSATTHASAIPLLQGLATGRVTSVGTQDAAIPHPRTRSGQLGVFGMAPLPVVASVALQYVPPTNFATIIQSSGYVAGTAYGAQGYIYSANDVIALAANSIVQQLTYVISSAVKVHGATSPLVEIVKRVDDTIGLAAAVGLLFRAQAATTVGFTGTITSYELRILSVIDAIGLSAGLTNTQDVDRFAATVFALVSQLDTPTVEQLVQALGVGNTLTTDITGFVQALSSLRLLATLDGTLLLTALVQDSIGLHGALTNTAEIMALLESALGLVATFGTGDEAYTAWVMDAESKAAWTYDNYPFNSFCQLGDRYLAAGPAGLFEIGGTLDDTDDIQWRARTGLLNFGTSFKKRIDRLYLGYTVSGSLGVSVITTSPEGDKVQYNYTMTTHTANAPTNDRVKIGRGLDSVYFAFQFSGTGEFSLSDVKVLPMVTTRRV